MLWLFWSPHMTQWTKFVNGKRISSYWFVNAKCIHLWMKSYGVTIDYFKSWKLLSATFLFSVYYAVQGGSTELSSLRTKSYSADVQMKATERYFRIFLLSFNRKIRRKMIMSWWVTANFFPFTLVFTETTQVDGTYGDPLVNAHRSPNDSVLKTTPETICEYLSFVILSKAMFTLYWKAFSGATTGGYLL